MVKVWFGTKKPPVRGGLRIEVGGRLHVAVKLLLAVCCAVRFALQSALAHQAGVWLAEKVRTLAEHTNEAGFLDLLLEALLQAVV